MCCTCVRVNSTHQCTTTHVGHRVQQLHVQIIPVHLVWVVPVAFAGFLSIYYRGGVAAPLLRALTSVGLLVVATLVVDHKLRRAHGRQLQVGAGHSCRQGSERGQDQD